MSLPDFKTFYKDMVIKIDCYWSKYRQQINGKEQILERFSKAQKNSTEKGQSLNNGYKQVGMYKNLCFNLYPTKYIKFTQN